MNDLTGNKRIGSLDVLRGLALMLIIFFHSSIYNFANIHKIDFENPPLLIIIMSFMALWGGVFIIYSMVINTIMLLRRSEGNLNFKPFRYVVITGLIYVVLHYLLNIFLGRWNIDFINNMPDLTVVAGSLRDARLEFPEYTKFFEGSSLSTIAFNLILLAPVLFLLLKYVRKERNRYILSGLTGTLIMILSFARISIFPMSERAVESHHYLLATFFSFTIANPYPLLPYMAYGLIGMMIGLMAYHGRKRLLKLYAAPLGLLFFLYGLAGMMQFDKSISKPDFFWYFKTCFELGIFILMAVPGLLIQPGNRRLPIRLNLLRWFSRVSLTIYLLETTTSELFRMVWLHVVPGWNQTINGCLLFGGMNVLLWSIILFLWQKAGFRFSIEYFWVMLFRRLGKQSTKMDFIF